MFGRSTESTTVQHEMKRPAAEEQREAAAVAMRGGA